MIIETLSITNFRQFFGEVILEMSTDKEKNITVVHGANGSGKTSLLNAFKWCFYGETDFDTSNENILNEASIQKSVDGAFIDLEIKVKFKHDTKQYEAIRQQRFKRINNTKAEPLEESIFVLDVTNEDGQTKRSKSPYKELQAIIPLSLQPYFFFNGERIEHIAGVNEGVQIQEAIRKLMGLEVVDRAITHVDKAKNIYRKLVRQKVSSEQQKLHDLIESLESNIKYNDEKHKKAKHAKALAHSEIKRIDRELRKYEKSRELQDKRNDLETRIDSNSNELCNIKIRQKRLIDENGFLVLSSNIFKECTVLVEENRKKGVLPYGIKEQFIDDRIEIQSCICGTKIEKGSKEHKCLLEVRKTAGTDEQESAYTSVSALLKSHSEIVERYERDYTEAANQVGKISSTNDGMRNEIDEISSQLIHLDDNKIASLETLHKIETSKHNEAIGNVSIATNSKDDDLKKLKKHKDLLERLEDQKSKQDVANRRMKKAEGIVITLSSLRESLANQVRVDLSARVDETFQSIIRKPVRAVIDDEYKLQILKKTSSGEEYVVQEQSTGERQVTSLSFIASIIALAKERHTQNSLFFQGGLYPLVMDSPFGALDDDYRKKVAAEISLLAEQVVMFVSNSQWEGEVKMACENKVGKSYQLIYHSPKLDKAKENEYMVVSDTDYEYATLKEVTL